MNPKKVRIDIEEVDERALKETTNRFTECRTRLEVLMEKYYPGWRDRIYSD